MKSNISRRTFLKYSITGAGLTIAAGLTPFGIRLVKAADEKSLGLKPFVYIEISPDNTVTVLVGQTELGQGTHTGLAMLVAEELEADWRQVRVRQAPAAEEFKDPFMNMQITGGSTSIRHRYELLRKAGASAREMLLEAAAQTWGVSAKECLAADSIVRHQKSKKSMTYGQLSAKAAELPVPQDPPLKPARQFKIIGTDRQRFDIPDKVSGSAKFGIDITVPDMWIAVVAHPPEFGSQAEAYDETAAGKVKGVLAIQPLESGVAVCAKTLDAALDGRKALNIKWSKGSHPDLDDKALENLFAEAIQKPGAVARKDGDANLAFGQAAKQLEATYFLPYLAHATMEPMNCTAHISKDRCQIWTPTQFQTAVQMAGSNISGLPPEKVDVFTTYCGGGFGRRAETHVVVEALQLSKAVGKAVKVIWTREDDFQNDFYRPGIICRIKGGLDEKGSLTAWSHKVVSASVMSRVFPQFVKDGIDSTAVSGIKDMDYTIPNIYVEYVMLEAPIPVGFWRSVGDSSNPFTVESFIDELAHLAGQDPLQFRLGMLKSNPRGRRVAEVLAEKSGWGKPLKKGQGRGMALRTSFGSTAGHVAEVSVEKSSGQITVHRIVCVLDCGPAVYPDAIRAQMEGGAIFGLSAALKERVRFANGGVATSNYDDYPILRMSETPKIEVHIVKSDDQIGGVGEPGVPSVAPAVGNAVFDAIGARIRHLPMTPANVLAAIKGA
jgi:isoquinoline 1-oxidoreductase beta subunit